MLALGIRILTGLFTCSIDVYKLGLILIGFLFSIVFLGMNNGKSSMPRAKHKNTIPIILFFEKCIFWRNLIFTTLFLERTFFAGVFFLRASFADLGIFFEED